MQHAKQQKAKSEASRVGLGQAIVAAEVIKIRLYPPRIITVIGQRRDGSEEVRLLKVTRKQRMVLV